MANYGVYGRIKIAGDCDADTSTAKVYPYFRKVDSGSDNSKWTNEPYPVDNDHYATFDLSDAQILDTTGVFKKGTDRVYIAVVLGGSGTLDSLDCTHVCFHQHTTINEDSIELNLNLHPKRAPIIDTHSFPNAILTQHNYTMSETSYSDTSWINNGCYDVSVSQKLLYDNVGIFDGHQLINTIYKWGEIADKEVANNSSDSYTFHTAGDYTISMTVREKWNTQTVVSQAVRIKYNEPIVDFNWTPIQTNDWDGSKIKGQEEITFHNNSSDLDNRTWDSNSWGNETYTYKWVISDKNQDASDNTATVTGAAHADTPKHNFQSEGEYDVTLTVYWNDGFDDHEKSITKKIKIWPFTIVPAFVWDNIPHNRGQDITFDPSSTSGDTDKISKYDWIIDDNYPAPDNANGLYTFASGDTSVFGEGSSDNTQSVDNQYTVANTMKPVVKFHSKDNKNSKVTITYSDGWKDVTNELVKVVTCERYDVAINFSISDNAPQGRTVDVTCSNTSANYTQDGTDIGYTIDWYLEDWYMGCNLDNPDSGNNTDNASSKIGVVKTEDIVHRWQNISENNAKLVIRYDDGWQRKQKEITKVIHPIVFQNPTPSISLSSSAPKGRSTEVEVTNSTTYDNTRCRGIDWKLNDWYMECNLDNPSAGNKTDNTIEYSRKAYDYKPKHNWQNTSDNEVWMKYWFDDGFCEQSVETTTIVHPIVYDAPTPDFTWTPEHPISRLIEVEFTDTTNDADNRFRSYDWIINDRYNKWNPDSSKYGVETVANVQTVNGETTKGYKPKHKFQDMIDSIIEMTYHYDDGFCDRVCGKSHVVSKLDYTIVPVINRAGSDIGKVENVYTNNSTGDTTAQLDEKWIWNDIKLDASNEVTVRDDQAIGLDQKFTWQYPSRKPYSAVDGATAANVNKKVELEVRLDNGWRNNTDDNGLGNDNTSGDGGKVYYYIAEMYEAKTKEIGSIISTEENIEGNNW